MGESANWKALARSYSNFDKKYYSSRKLSQVNTAYFL
jgi:hypothetical protein